MGKPSKAAIAALRKDPALSIEFDQKYGAGASAPHLQGTGELAEKMAAMLDAQAASNTKLAEMATTLAKVVAVNDALNEINRAMLDHMKAPKRVVKNAQGEVVGIQHAPDQAANAGSTVDFQPGSDPLSAKLDRVIELNEALIAHIKAPKRVVRDRDGEIIGVEPVTKG